MQERLKYENAQQIPDDKLPEVYDLRHVNGHDFTSFVKDQEHCGSCHTMSFLGAVESRLKLKFGFEDHLSAQHILSCNYLNEGCEGGWSMFNGYLMENGHFVSEQCGPYRGSTVGDKCKFYEKC